MPFRFAGFGAEGKKGTGAIMKQYKFGDCIPESEKMYRSLRDGGYNPVMVEGLVCPVVSVKDRKNITHTDQLKPLIPHTWVKLENEIIDVTKNQFDAFGGIHYYKSVVEYNLKRGFKMLVALYHFIECIDGERGFHLIPYKVGQKIKMQLLRGIR